MAAVADRSLIAGRRGRRDDQLRLAEEAYALAGEVGLLDALEEGEVHTARGVALAAQGRTGGGAAGAGAGRVPAPAGASRSISPTG